jgi:hypothetical protein
MPSQKRVEESNGLDTSATPDEAGGAGLSLTARMTAFGLLTLGLVIMAAWFVLTAVREPRAERLTAQQEVQHTVKVLEMPAAERDAAQSLLDHSTLVKLADGHRLHLLPRDDEKLALCMGAFDSEQSPEARQVLRRVRDFTREGKKAFPAAEIIAYAPRASR